MLSITQIIRNLFIRLEGLLYQIFGFFRQIWDSLYRLLVSFTKLLGFSKAEYFLESNETTAIKPTITKPVAEEVAKASPSNTANRRRPDASMDYYRKLAQQQNRS